MINRTFPPIPESKLEREDVIGHLVVLNEMGWNVYADNESFIIVLNETDSIRISPVHEGYRIQLQTTLIERSLVAARASNMAQLRSALEQYLPQVAPSTIRTSRKEPATNYSKLANLIGHSCINAVYDPYLDDIGLNNLLTLGRLTNAVSSELRLLTSDKGAKRLNINFVKSFFVELGCDNCQIKVITSEKPHRRFILLSSGQSLIIGFSLNDLAKNEAAHLETDALDRRFFEAEWIAAKNLLSDTLDN